METYKEMIARHQKEVDNFPFIFAFSVKQLEEGKKQMGIQSNSELLSIGAGGFIRKTDEAAMTEMFDRQRKEQEDNIAADKTGEGFIKGMFAYELANHEYCVTYDLEDTLDALGMTLDEVNGNPALANGLKLALKRYRIYLYRPRLERKIFLHFFRIYS